MAAARTTRYRHLVIDGAGEPPTAEEVALIEGLLGAELPASFREYLRVANGGYLEYVVDVPIDENRTEELQFGSLFRVRGETRGHETLLGEIEIGRQQQGLPDQVLPFARDGGGSMVYLDLTPEGKGRVVAFVMGLPAWTGLRATSAFIELAPSFDDYVGKLRVNREMLLDTLENDTTTADHIQAMIEFLDVGLPGWRSDDELTALLDAARERVLGAREDGGE